MTHSFFSTYSCSHRVSRRGERWRIQWCVNTVVVCVLVLSVLFYRTTFASNERIHKCSRATQDRLPSHVASPESSLAYHPQADLTRAASTIVC